MQWIEATLQQKNAAIELKDELIAQLREGRVFEVAQATPSPKKEDERKIPLAKGMFHLKKWDVKFGDVDFPRMYDLMREWLLGDSANETLAEYFEKHGFRLFERSAPALPPNEERPAFPPISNED